MYSVICTLFEKDYHHGLAALTNSLYNNGFRGDIYAGYRGALPDWTSLAQDNEFMLWPGSKTLEVNKGLKIHFLPVNTQYHLTNYKPEFMIHLWSGPAKDADVMVYFDPDIVIKCKWTFYEKWTSYGIALVHEAISNDMPPTHPIRLEWEKVIKTCNMRVTRQLYSYINGGFCGVSRQYSGFLKVWAGIMNSAIQHYGLEPAKFMPSDRTNIFYASDQDALNIAAMCCEVPISEVGPEGMDFIHGGWLMSHAVGSQHKPWRKKFILEALKGNSPSLAERGFWKNVKGPVMSFPTNQIKLRRLSILIAAFIGRFYRR